MVNFKQIEEDAVKALKDVVHEAAANEPTVGQAVQVALEGAGVPPALVGVAVGLVENLLAHFTPKPAPEPAPTTSPEPAQSSEQLPAEEAAHAAPPFPQANPA